MALYYCSNNSITYISFTDVTKYLFQFIKCFQYSRICRAGWFLLNKFIHIHFFNSTVQKIKKMLWTTSIQLIYNIIIISHKANTLFFSLSILSYRSKQFATLIISFPLFQLLLHVLFQQIVRNNRNLIIRTHQI